MVSHDKQDFVSTWWYLRGSGLFTFSLSIVSFHQRGDPSFTKSVGHGLLWFLLPVPRVSVHLQWGEESCMRPLTPELLLPLEPWPLSSEQHRNKNLRISCVYPTATQQASLLCLLPALTLFLRIWFSLLEFVNIGSCLLFPLSVNQRFISLSLFFPHYHFSEK